MRILGLKTLRKSAVMLKKRFINGAVILGYHRICNITNDPYNITVSTHNFTDQLKVLKKVANVISLNELVHCINSGELPKRTVALTFDDGYLDNLNEVVPRLDSVKMPATFFLTTGFLGQEPWWDKLARLVYNALSIPDYLSLSFESGLFTWKKPRYASNSHNNLSDHSQNNLLLALYQFSLTTSAEVREQLAAQLENRIGKEGNSRPSTRLLSEDEVLQVVSSDLVEIGAHSVNHPMMACLPESEQLYEIEHSKEYLERLLNRKIYGFSYPNGSVSHKTKMLVEKAGYSNACGSHNDLVWSKRQVFHLPRLWVPDVNGDEFTRWLKRWVVLS
jgi:peptidoglycan/xylan/chitin deacetylase (PgdA/CDA1 family)